MKIEQSYFRGVAVLQVRGELDYFQAAPLLKEVEKQRDLGYVKVVLDLKRVPYVNSTALGSILRAKNDLAKAGGRLVIAEPSGMVRKVLETTRLIGPISVHATVIDAVKALLDAGEAIKAGEGVEPSEPVEVTTAEGVVIFEFADDFKAGRFGKRNSIGRLERIGTEELTFVWPKAASGDEASSPPGFDPDQVFERGTGLGLTFSLKSFRKDFYFRIHSVVSSCDVREDHRLRICVKYKNLATERRSLLEQYLADQKIVHDEGGRT
ncbi:MAG: STAS domain-containing protein [Planctomycetes bacterium]|nr:STAS domain-containing protein [Planctomycetota bacterium]